LWPKEFEKELKKDAIRCGMLNVPPGCWHLAESVAQLFITGVVMDECGRMRIVMVVDE
jgi:hypothetical protein